MAAISALMINENVIRKEPFDEEHTPTTPRAASSMLSPSRSGNTVSHMSSEDQAQQHTQDARPSSSYSNTTKSQSNPSETLQSQREDDDSDAMDVDQDGSENEGDQGESGTSSRKKKGQRFFCTGYPPCSLSFTRSEHLARHIRKHTGERPFQCHCNRRFSRLDNLRQHAQTVHVNEEIPTDSLAATGTRFQRQIRTERVRPAGRPRSGTMSSTGSHSRGHSRNLSTSSIGSTSSNFSTSTIDPRRRPPPPLLMASDGRPKLGIELPSTPPPQFGPFSTHSPGDINTPTSATLSIAPNSPAFGSTLGSPGPAVPRGTFFSGSHTPGRRLSVPSAPHPFPSPYPPPFPSYTSQPGPASTTISSNNSTITSPTSSTFSHGAGFQPSSTEDWRRRTWHPSTYSAYNRPATSGLTYSQTPDAPQPAFAQNATAAAGQAPRLPGIESFDHVQQRPTTPPRNNAGGPNLDQSRPATLMPPAEIASRGHGHGHGHRRHVSADIPRYNHYIEVGDRTSSERTTSSWMHETLEQINQLGPRVAQRQQDLSRHPMGPPPPAHILSSQSTHQHPHEAPHVRPARGGWLQGNGTTARTSPEDSGSSEGVPTPGTSTADVNPAIMPTSGILDSQHAAVTIEASHNPCFAPPQPLARQFYDPRAPSQPHRVHAENTELNRLDALAAVATSENDPPQRS